MHPALPVFVIMLMGGRIFASQTGIPPTTTTTTITPPSPHAYPKIPWGVYIPLDLTLHHDKFHFALPHDVSWLGTYTCIVVLDIDGITTITIMMYKTLTMRNALRSPWGRSSNTIDGESTNIIVTIIWQAEQYTRSCIKANQSINQTFYVMPGTCTINQVM